MGVVGIGELGKNQPAKGRPVEEGDKNNDNQRDSDFCKLHFLRSDFTTEPRPLLARG